MRNDWSHQPNMRGRDWPGSRRVLRAFVLIAALFVAIPIALGAVITAAFAGWTGAAVAVIVSLALLAAAVRAARFGFRTFRSVREFVVSTERLSQGDYSARVSDSASPLYRPVARSFNQMADRLETADEHRRRLLADLGHELRTPLTIIRGELEAIADGVRPLDDDRVRILLDDVAGMEHLLDDLKTLSTAEAGVLELDRERTDMVQLASEIVERFINEAASTDVELTVADASEARASLQADVDRRRIGEVLTNLVANALRVTGPNGKIVLTVKPDLLNGEAGVRIDVADTGPGIAPDQLQAVFDRFHKGSDSHGSGLGLTISREIVHAHGGTIEITSDLGVGTTITVLLTQAEPV